MSSSSLSSSVTTSQISALAPSDIAHAISLIQAAYAPTAASDLPALQSLQSALLAMQRTPAAWGLIVPLLAHEDVNVQFFGAHTAHAKISRGEMAALPAEEQAALRDALVEEETRGVGVGQARGSVQSRLFRPPTDPDKSRTPPTADHEREHHLRSDKDMKWEEASTTETREDHSQKDSNSADDDPDKHRFHQHEQETRLGGDHWCATVYKVFAWSSLEKVKIQCASNVIAHWIFLRAKALSRI
ncbi:hypothetical protein B0H13DRAFT_2455977 [Mycena leptocephala]|nr:hypothetical protein B0H13DRAFT_2455977 [Mycena leptocephala]